ncbi:MULTISPECIES: YheC/YheD family endospore coat-associated protein [Brevibacillus]|jgi:glutathione synthase/RimK-type ligase-like ATP-grasp enzyme|uniref:YheC/YheD family endospore coat-associated protein n=1 Tax=Brevibacillus TaxID=55080 RepID=UPI00057C2DD6|nr:YheC/YheD family protein [Brevibacillus borstelensis]MBE5397554.1 YheC/YheD family protein [Brevibacillus borstelensis]MCC0564965.1 YheC/YheD family protein [Brevibacillus borstelensis]MCM3469195.1 YheC/YheD family protein [Brevibacillus borstelensis]MCM3560084.1 YheC/YheD family protein [Brevibacillus borstelensis]MCM3589715.1 YheC/YheD family protein [Brevibacillus borstelensis]
MLANQKSLGIITICRGSSFVEKGYYKKLTLIGRKAGIRVFVFSPRQVDFSTRTVTGFEYRDGSWRSGTFPLPAYIYDRCFVGPSYRHYKPFVEKLQNDPSITFLGHGLSGKWQVHQMLIKSPLLAKWLPPTSLFSFPKLQQTLKRHGSAIIKPIAGTHGIGVVRIDQTGDSYHLTGRNLENQPFSKTIRTQNGLNTYLAGFIGGRTFLVQPYLSLHTPDGTPFDVRVLVQKNGNGEWETTGKAVRLGNKQSITSNLHGGGKAAPLPIFLAKHFSEKTRSKIEMQLDQLVAELPPFLELEHGRLVELGIDVGIDTSGNIWIIEVNSRPGRTVFRMIDDPKARLHSITQPVRYARYLMKHA